MTVYARIADKKVAEEYFAVTEKVEALYDQPRQLASGDEGTEMSKLRGEMHRRMLGNGYCARPVEMDCHSYSTCENCTFFVTTIEFRPTLQRQRGGRRRQGAGRPNQDLRRPPRTPRPRRLIRILDADHPHKYNNRRLQSSLGHLTPAEYEVAHYATLTREPQPI